METPSAEIPQARPNAALRPQLALDANEPTQLRTEIGRLRGRQGDLRLHVTILSGVAGFVDAAGFVAMMGIFPAHLTGELVSAGVQLARGNQLSYWRLSLVPLFMLGVAIAATITHITKRRLRSDPLPTLLSLMALTLAVCAASEWLCGAFLPYPGARFWCVAGSSVCAIAFQGVFMREAHKSACPTTVMTGNLTLFFIELVELVLSRLGIRQRGAELVGAPEQRLSLVASALFAFIASAALGAWLTLRSGSASMALPALAAAGLASRSLLRAR